MMPAYFKLKPSNNLYNAELFYPYVGDIRKGKTIIDCRSRGFTKNRDWMNNQ